MTAPVVVVSPDDLRRMIAEAVADAMADHRPPEAEWLDLRAAAELAGVHRETLRRHIGQGRLRAHRAGGRLWRIRRADVAAYVEGDR